MPPTYIMVMPVAHHITANAAPTMPEIAMAEDEGFSQQLHEGDDSMPPAGAEAPAHKDVGRGFRLC